MTLQQDRLEFAGFRAKRPRDMGLFLFVRPRGQAQAEALDELIASGPPGWTIDREVAQAGLEAAAIDLEAGMDVPDHSYWFEHVRPQNPDNPPRLQGIIDQVAAGWESPK